MEEFWIDGFGISNYRSFGPEPQLIGPCGKVNLIVGQNNCGKSNVLRFLAEHYSRLLSELSRSREYTHFSDLDNPVGCQVGARSFWLGLRLDKGRIEQHATIGSGETLRHINLGILERLLRLKPFASENGVAWFEYGCAIVAGKRQLFSEDFLAQLERCQSEFNHQAWLNLEQNIFNSSSGNMRNAQTKVLRAIGPVRTPFPNVSMIPATRKVDGNLIKQLAELQHPSKWNKQEGKGTFLNIGRFLQTVTDNHDATIEITNDPKSILVNVDDKTLPLEALGTGIHEVIIIAAHATVRSRHVICIEEPEIHLHPTLQRKLIRYLQSDTDNQYFIATHSAHILDSPEANVFHVRWENGHSVVQLVGSPGDRCSVCFDLGYRPSDLVQANCIIWVEGPSDRIYLNHWIESVDSGLAEGTHYSIMFYGGRLLSHLSADDPEVNDFISLRRLNRRMIVLMDSDKDSSDGDINPTKKRICDELSGGEGFAWVTQGRDIENYIPVELTTSAIQSIHEDWTVPHVDDPVYGRRLQFPNDDGKTRTVDKIKVARCVVNQQADLTVLDLQEMVQRTVDFIRESNEMCSTP